MGWICPLIMQMSNEFILDPLITRFAIIWTNSNLIHLKEEGISSHEPLRTGNLTRYLLPNAQIVAL